MKFLWLFCVVSVILSCSRQDISMEIFETNSGKVSYKTLLEKGFEKSAVDVMMFEKQNGDTTVIFEFNYELEKLNSKRWSFYLPYSHKDSLKTLFEKNNNYLMVPDTYEKININNFFCIKSSDDNEVFFCLIEDVNDDKAYCKVDIVYYYLLNE